MKHTHRECLCSAVRQTLLEHQMTRVNPDVEELEGFVLSSQLICEFTLQGHVPIGLRSGGIYSDTSFIHTL